VILRFRPAAGVAGLARRRIGLAAVIGIVGALSAATSACAGGSSDSAVVPPEGTVAHAGRWLVDADGRVWVVHGVNVPSKTLPAYPAALGFGDADAALLAASGLDAVRITVERYAVEPAPGHFDDALIGHIAATVDLLARHGILSLIDFHQDEYGPVFHDNGFPDWMTVTDGLPNLYQIGFPGQYLANPALERAFDHFWANDTGPDGTPLQIDDERLLSHVARELAGHAGVLGYEIMNEPWPGSAYPTCVVPAIGCPTFDKGPLSAYYDRIVPAVRRADPAHMIFYEPLSTFNLGVPTSVVPPADSRLGFAFHDYSLCATALESASASSPAEDRCATEDALVLSNAQRHAAATGDALLETEFGATTDTRAITRQLGQYDAAMISWMFWSYTHYIDPYAPDGRLEPPTATNIDQAVLAALARPYPELVSGTPVDWSFNPTTTVFRLTYSTGRADGHGTFPAGSETDIAVPKLQYPHGYVARVRGGTVASAPNAPVLRIRSLRRSGRITVVVIPAGYAGRPNSACPYGATHLGGGVSVSGPILGGPCSPQLLPWQQPDTGPGPPPGAVCGSPPDPRPAIAFPSDSSPLQVDASGSSDGGDVAVVGNFGGAQGASGDVQVTGTSRRSEPAGEVTAAGQSKGGGGVVSVGNDGDQDLYPLTPPGMPIADCQD